MLNKLKFVNIVLLLAAFALLGLLIKDYLSYSRIGRRPVQASQAATAASTRKPLQEYAPVVETPVYPAESRRLVPLNAAGADFKKGALPSVLSELKLLGVYAGHESYAVFERAGVQGQKVFKTGDTVFDAGVLKEVGAKSAIVAIGPAEVSFKVFMEEPPSGAPVDRPQPQDEPRSQIQPPGAPQGQHSQKVGDTEWVLDQRAVLNSIDNISSIMTDARLTPKVVKGAVEGFLVNEIKPRGVFDAIGLKNGDVLTRINGYEIDSPEKAVQVLSGLKGSTAVDLDIVRGGQKMSFHYEIK